MSHLQGEDCEECGVGGSEVEQGDMERMDAMDEYLVPDWDPTDAD